MTNGYSQIEQQLRSAVAARAESDSKRGLVNRLKHPHRGVLGLAALTFVGTATAGAVAINQHFSGIDSAPDKQAGQTFGRSLQTIEVSVYGANPEKTKELTIRGRNWSFSHGTEGALCVQVPSRTTSCATSEEIARGLLSVTSIAAPTGADRTRRAEAIRKIAASGGGPIPRDVEASPPTPAIKFGVVDDNIQRVRAIDNDGSVIEEVDTDRNTYALRIGLDGDAKRIEMVDATGKVVVTTAP